jgi:hypothetical protein
MTVREKQLEDALAKIWKADTLSVVKGDANWHRNVADAIYEASKLLPEDKRSLLK